MEKFTKYDSLMVPKKLSEELRFGSIIFESIGIKIPNPNISKIIPIISKKIRIKTPFLCLDVNKKFILSMVLNMSFGQKILSEFFFEIIVDLNL